ncbi:HEPN domain-containing protein [Mucilaginibacter kameinonensis]|uniref:HEPN domain-containing protein n=1 Tax=Mucilaginibacter kameinonensis TaxID=452286 RepID=UPI000EF7D582|nr:HEPN domain-containing protein [Mucilaginibacter kameinonensis]
MEAKQNSNQPFYSKFLNRNEIASPIAVIGDFFSADWLPGHLGKLKEWRQFVIEDGFYTGKSPASLLMTHQLSARLLEAMYLLIRSKAAKKRLRTIHINFDEQLAQEEREWLHYPVFLSPLERINPYLAISNLFEIYTIDQYLTFLYEWLEAGLSVSTIDDDLDMSDVIYFYENMQKLYEAAWIIHQREIRPVLKNSVSDKNAAAFPPQTATQNLSLVSSNCTFNDRLSPETALGLDQLVKFIVSKIPAVQLISCLGTHPSPSTFYLLVVVSDNNQSPEHEIANRIEDSCRQYVNIYVILSKANQFIQGLEEGNKFFTNAMVKSKISYQPDEFFEPQLKPIDNEVSIKEIETDWKMWGGQGREFLDSAWHCINKGSNGITLFLLHQAMESTLSAIIRIVLGYRLTVHNLSKLLRLTRLFTDDLAGVFDYSSDEDVRLLALLQSGYYSGRYKDLFAPDINCINILADKVSDLFAIAEEIYRKAVMS